MSTYFLKTLPASKNKTVCTGDRYKRIKDALADEATIVYLHFVSFLASSLTDFVKLFQSSSPLVHILYDKLNELVRFVMLKFLKSDAVQGKDGALLVDVKCNHADNWLPLKEVDIGMGTRLAVSKVKNDNKRTELWREFKQCFKSIATFMQTRLPLTNPVLRDLSCLQPKNRKVDKAKSAISRLCLHMKKVTKTDEFCDRVNAEWMVYMSDSSVDTLQEDFDTTGDICAYWQKVSEVPNGSGGKKYASLSVVAKTALILSHGNAIPERGFSINNAMLGKEKLSLSEKTIVAQRIVKDTVKIFGSVTDVPITKDVINAARKAYTDYKLYLEEQQRATADELQKKIQAEKEAQEKRQLLKTKESILKQLTAEEKAEQEQKHELDTAKELLSEASTKMATAIQQSNMQSIKVAQMMLKAGNDKLQETSSKLDAIQSNQQRLRKRLESCCGNEDKAEAKKKKL